MTVQPVPDGYSTVTPYLAVSNVPEVLRFVQAAFAAEVTEQMTLENGTTVHAEVRIGDSRVMLGQNSEGGEPAGFHLYLYVPNIDELYTRALAAGAKTFQEPADQFYGDRTAAVVGPCGTSWWMATHVEDVAPEEMARRAQEARG